MTEREQTLKHLKESQVCLAALTIVGRAETINKGRLQLAELIMSLDDQECAGLIFGVTEMLAVHMMQKADTPADFYSALEKSGTLLSIAIENLEASQD